MSLEAVIQALTAAVTANTAALTATAVAPTSAPAATAAPRTRPRPEAPVAPAVPAGIDKKALIAKLTELCNIPNGRAECTALCVKHGSATKNASGLDASKYQAVFDEAQTLIDAAAADPAA